VCKGESRGFAFVKFFAVEAAQLYMEQHYPVVLMGSNKVKIAYSLGRGEEDNGWTCQQVDLFRFCLFHLAQRVVFSVHWSTSRDEKLVIDVDFPVMVCVYVAHGY